MTTTVNINNTVAFVTGTNKKNGIGRAIVDSLLENGAKKVYATARDATQLDELVASSPVGRVVAVSLDVTSKEEVAQLAKKYPDVTLVVNNAGYGGVGGNSLSDDDDAISREMEVNYFAPLRIVRSFAPILNDQENTGIVNVASIASMVNFSIAATYSASKAAAHSLTQAQRRDLGKKTLVVGVYPGPIDTDMAEGFEMDKAAPSEVARAIVEALKSGNEDVFPDPMSVQLHEGWQKDAKAVERMMAAPQS